MTKAEMLRVYHAYIECLNRQDWAELGRYVADDAMHNGRPFGLAGYREMLEKDFRDIPDLRFNVRLLAVDPPMVASRLDFDCSPVGDFMGLAVDGRRVSFSENVFYEFEDGKIARVWSVVDKMAIESQLPMRGGANSTST
ncbi:ester cyclase [Variovorax sp. KK3]|uniref:ester cyclase n=1 Tax=Variovorax sp. KK3 TaxID=1855728 RepID=UPI00097C5D75|nr:ester cyclase [Variovorax sp. KK3]